MGCPVISTERLVLPRWIESDIEQFADMNKDAEVMKYFPKTLTVRETIGNAGKDQFEF